MDNRDDIAMEELEDGELSSNSCDHYTPLERPQNYCEEAKPKPVIQDSDSEEHNQSTDDDSDDSDSAQKLKSKRPKFKLIPKKTNTTTRKKYDIWTTKVQEDVLSETLNSCDVTQKDRSRDVESYDYTMAYKHGNSNKRTREERANVHRRLGKRKEEERESGKGAARIIPDLNTTIENTEEEIASDMANKLCELKEELIVRSLQFIGKEKCFDVFRKTQEIEADGGMSIMNYTRRRTPGGVFFYLIKMDESIDQKLKSDIFIEERRRDSKEKKKRQVQKWKAQKDKQRAKILPELISKADLEEAAEAVPKNPPPTPETDTHDNSCDDNECSVSADQSKPNNKINNEQCNVEFNSDVLDIHCSNMEMS